MTLLTLLLLACTSAKPGAGVDSGTATSTGSSADDTGSAVTTDADGDGFLAGPDGTDCDDNDASVYPGAEETCGDGVDQDCDGAELGCTGRLMSTMGGGYLKGGGQVYGLGRDLAVLHGWRDDADALTVAMAAPWWEVESYVSLGAVFFVHPEDIGGAAQVDTRASSMIHGHESNQVLGWSIDSGDIDGDGIDDLLVGEPSVGDTGEWWGGAWVVYGPIAEDQSIQDAGAQHLTGARINEPDGFFSSISSDITGDGQSDLVLGRPQSCNTWDVGGAHIVSHGRIVARQLDEDDIEVFGESFCVGLASDMDVGDFNGDGIDDLALAAYTDGKSLTVDSVKDEESGPGRAYIILGPITASTSIADADGRIDGAINGSLFGASLDISEDQDGDGLDDLLVGAQSEDNAGGDVGGAAYLISGSVVATTAVVTDVATARFQAEKAAMELGNGVSDGGDQDGDGYREVLVSAESTKANGFRGQVFVFAGPLAGTLTTDDAILEVFGRSDRDHFGSGFNGYGAGLLGGVDLNQDGSDDWLVGADLASDGDYEYCGAVYTFYGGLWP